MISFTQNCRGQHDIIKKIIISTKQGTDTIHAVFLTKYHKYPSTTILKHLNVLDKVTKPPYEFLIDMMPHDPYSIPIHVRIINISYISHKKKE